MEVEGGKRERGSGEGEEGSEGNEKGEVWEMGEGGIMKRQRQRK